MFNAIYIYQQCSMRQDYMKACNQIQFVVKNKEFFELQLGAQAGSSQTTSHAVSDKQKQRQLADKQTADRLAVIISWQTAYAVRWLGMQGSSENVLASYTLVRNRLSRTHRHKRKQAYIQQIASRQARSSCRLASGSSSMHACMLYRTITLSSQVPRCRVRILARTRHLEHYNQPASLRSYQY